jgi:two-component system cell cycle response regulator DivK
MADAKARKVLVVEDNELNMRLFCDLLDAYGYETYQCRDGAKAVEIARREQPDSSSWTSSCRKYPVSISRAG